MKNIALIVCSKRKIKDSNEHYAKDVYTGQTFKKSLANYNRFCDEYLILSEKHYVLEPNDVIKSYKVEKPLRKRTISAKKKWSKIVTDKLFEKYGENIYEYNFYIFGSHYYYDYLPKEMHKYSFRFNYRIIDLTNVFEV